MQESTNFGLKLFDGADPFSRLVFNQNWNLLDEVIKTQREEVDSALQERAEEVDSVLKDHAEDLVKRSKVLVGSYVGTEPVATDSFYDDGSANGYGTTTTFTNKLGLAKSSTDDVVLADVDFEPGLIVVSAYDESAYTYTGVESYFDGAELHKTAKTVSGKETRTFALMSAKTSAVVPFVFEQIGPGFIHRNMAITQAKFTQGNKKPIGANGSEIEYNLPWLIGKAFVQVTPVNGKWRVTIKGANQEYNTENFANIAGMTYNWMILGK